jgi:hypothetical protein
VVYQIFSDDSYSDEFYTVAGYIAPVAVWEEFGPTWFAVLKERPRLGFYRTSDALALKGPFAPAGADLSVQVCALKAQFTPRSPRSIGTPACGFYRDIRKTVQ